MFRINNWKNRFIINLFKILIKIIILHSNKKKNKKIKN